MKEITPDTVIVSLTSHSIRLESVGGATIFSIINNTYANKHIVLTLSKEDAERIPDDLRLLIRSGLVELIIVDEDLGPHTKYYYAMSKYRSNPIITVDDDVIYPENMIETMLHFYKKYPNCIIARRSFSICVSNGHILPYHIWLNHFSGKTEPTHKIFATGIGGILYPPDCLKVSETYLPEIRTVKFDDDFFLKAIEMRNNLKIVNICNTQGELYKCNLCDSHTQSIARWNANRLGGSDNCVKLFQKEFNDAIK